MDVKFKKLVMIPVITQLKATGAFRAIFQIKCLIPLSGVRELSISIQAMQHAIKRRFVVRTE